MEHKPGVVMLVDKNSKQLTTALNNDYYQATGVAETTDPNVIYDIKNVLDSFMIYQESEIGAFAKVFFMWFWDARQRIKSSARSIWKTKNSGARLTRYCCRLFMSGYRKYKPKADNKGGCQSRIMHINGCRSTRHSPIRLLSNFTVQHNLLAFISKSFFVGVYEVWNPFILLMKVDDLNTIDKRVIKGRKSDRKREEVIT